MPILHKVYLEHKTGGHSKFYEITLLKHEQSALKQSEMFYEVRTRHGRIGTKGRELWYGHYSDTATAIQDIAKIKKEKVAKGYKEVTCEFPTQPKGEKEVKQPAPAMGRFARLLG